MSLCYGRFDNNKHQIYDEKLAGNINEANFPGFI